MGLRRGDQPKAGRFRAEQPVLGKSAGLGKWASGQVCNEVERMLAKRGCRSAENRRSAGNSTFSGTSILVPAILLFWAGEEGAEWILAQTDAT